MCIETRTSWNLNLGPHISGVMFSNSSQWGPSPAFQIDPICFYVDSVSIHFFSLFFRAKRHPILTYKYNTPISESQHQKLGKYFNFKLRREIPNEAFFKGNIFLSFKLEKEKMFIDRNDFMQLYQIEKTFQLP